LGSGKDLLIIHPHLDVTGGSEKLTQILIEELARRGYELVVLSRGFGKDFPKAPNIHYELLTEVSEMGDKRLDRLLGLFKSIAATVMKHDPAVIFAMIQEPVYLMLSKIADPRKRTAIYIHFPFEEELTKENITRFLEMHRFPGMYEDMFKFVDLRLTNSNYTARALYKHFGLNSNVVYPAIPWEYYLEEPDLTADPGPSIISVGRFVPQKRLDILIKLFKERIKKEVKEARLTIVGVPDERYQSYYEELKRLAESAEDIEIIDKPLTPRDLIKLYREARVYAHLRIGEHFGMAPVEAMTQGAIPVLPRKSGLAELLTHGYNGYSYVSDEELVTYVIKVLRMARDEYLELRRRAHVKSLYFTPERFASDVEGYLGLIKGA